MSRAPTARAILAMTLFAALLALGAVLSPVARLEAGGGDGGALEPRLVWNVTRPWPLAAPPVVAAQRPLSARLVCIGASAATALTVALGFWLWARRRRGRRASISSCSALVPPRV